VVRVPSPEAEDARHLHRELQTLRRDRTRVTNRIKAVLATQGVQGLELGPQFEEEVERIELWDGLPMPEQVLKRVKREWATVVWLNELIRAVERERRTLLRSSEDPAVAKVRQLLSLNGGIGLNSAWLFVDGVLWVAGVSEPSGGGGSGGADADAASERGLGTGAGDRQGGQPPRARDGDRDRMVLAALST
jgi:hypothetical protein